MGLGVPPDLSPRGSSHWLGPLLHVQIRVSTHDVCIHSVVAISGESAAQDSLATQSRHERGPLSELARRSCALNAEESLEPDILLVMREIRPTIRVLKNLPRETFDDPEPFDLVTNSDFGRLNLYGIKHPLLADGRKRFSSGLPDQHKSASKAANSPIFEVRDREGAGWRGAVWLDPNGDPWLVYVEKHDKFHRCVKERITSSECQPKPAEYKLRDREEAAQQGSEWRKTVLQMFADGLCEAVRQQIAVSLDLPGLTPGKNGPQVTVDVEHDAPQDLDTAHAHQGLSLVSAKIRINAAGSRIVEAAVIGTCLPFLQPDANRIEPAYGQNGTLTLYAEVSHSKLIQLLSGATTDQDLHHDGPERPDCLHYVGIPFLIEGYVKGLAVRGVCGAWFVPTRDDRAELPICPECETDLPAAEEVLALLRQSVR